MHIPSNNRSAARVVAKRRWEMGEEMRGLLEALSVSES